MRKEKLKYVPFSKKELEQNETKFLDPLTVRQINNEIIDISEERSRRNLKRELRNWQYEIILQDQA